MFHTSEIGSNTFDAAACRPHSPRRMYSASESPRYSIYLLYLPLIQTFKYGAASFDGDLHSRSSLAPFFWYSIYSPHSANVQMLTLRALLVSIGIYTAAALFFLFFVAPPVPVATCTHTTRPHQPSRGGGGHALKI